LLKLVEMSTKNQIKMNRLTKAEEQIMHILWDLERGLVRDVIEKLPDPKPAYNTVSTVIRILEKKGFVDHKAYGTTYEYFPIINKEEYTRVNFSHLMKDYFNNSFPEMAAFFARENNLSLEELQDMLKITEDELKK
jgi:BlaI family transcriptional regulator, penicillinase repressor